MTVTEAFAMFKGTLELPDRQQNKASTAQQELRSAISKHLGITTSFLSGSYARFTKIAPLKDIDVILVRNSVRTGLTTDGSGTLPTKAITEVSSAVRQVAPNATITPQARSVNVVLPGISFGFDLVPAWYRDPDGFWIPDTELGQWLPTNPEYHARLMTDANKASDGKLKPMIKMAKHWSRHNYDYLRSFHIELICLNIATKFALENAQTNMTGFLGQLPAYIGSKMMDPTYGVSRVDKEITPTQLSELQQRVAGDVNRARAALAQEQQGDHGTAIASWKQVFLTGFPE
jgi:hypothetical protein